MTREHHDVDVAVLRQDLDLLWNHVRGWTVWINEPGRFVRWEGGPLDEGDACFMARPDDRLVLERADFAAHPESVELMLEDVDGDEWVYRRDHRVRDRSCRLGPSGSFLAPELALLYKATQADEAKNSMDFTSALPRLDHDQRRWLADALACAHPGHPWVAALR